MPVTVTSSGSTIAPTTGAATVTVTVGGTVNVGGSSGYTHTQGSAASTWVITHSLGRFPSITVVDSAGDVILGFDATYDSANQITVTFTAPFSGKAYLN